MKNKIEHLEKINTLCEIIRKELISTVYQPIVSLKNRNILGYEALSRILIDGCKINIEELFSLAEQTNRGKDLEHLCHIKTLLNAKEKPLNKKLFINVDANILYNTNFKSKFMYKELLTHDLNSKDIIFEITEKNAIYNMDAFLRSVKYLQKQNFKIAIDDFGSGHSNFKRVCNTYPNYIKIDMELIRNIHESKIRKTLIKNLVNFCHDSGIYVIAEGVEVFEEMITLTRLNVDYAQGYYFSKPKKEFATNDVIKSKFLQTEDNLYKKEKISFGLISSISTNSKCILYNESALIVFNKIKRDETIQDLCVINDKNEVCGLITRSKLLETFGGQYGYNLHNKLLVKDIIDENYLCIHKNMTINNVAKLAMDRNYSQIYDPIIVSNDNNKYYGIVTVKDLLLSAMDIQVNKAESTNPLTKFPGNLEIQNMISKIIENKQQRYIIYLDLDNFKAYNDNYGFTNGDKIIKHLAKSIKKSCDSDDFIGHIGGDDFVIITQKKDIKNLTDLIINRFKKDLKRFYNDTDWNNKYITSKNRNGFRELFDLTTVSIAVVKYTNDIDSMEKLSKKITFTKKKSKEIKGNSVYYS